MCGHIRQALHRAQHPDRKTNQLQGRAHQKASVRASGDRVAASDTSHCRNAPTSSMEPARAAVVLPRSCASCCRRLASRCMPST